MDPVLAQMYGTGESDLEKMAEAELAEALGAETGTDIGDLDEETLEALAQEVINEGGDDNGEDDGSEKVAEADFLGRVMAHAYTQEMEQIKTAASLAGIAHGAAHGDMSKLPGWLKDKVKAVGGRTGELLKGGKMTTNGHRAGNELDALFNKGTRGEFLKSQATRVGAAGAGAYGLKKVHDSGRKKKHASAIDTLAMARAQEILEEQGAQVDPREALAQVVEQRALEMLQGDE